LKVARQLKTSYFNSKQGLCCFLAITASILGLKLIVFLNHEGDLYICYLTTYWQLWHVALHYIIIMFY